MERFAIVVDSSADLTQEQYDAMHIDGFIPLSFSIDGKEYLSYPDERELTAEELYATLRNTKAANKPCCKVRNNISVKIW
mgnify:CR=1 FL=1